ncbi:hypothetical protein CFO_g1457 [Ceratocystis platani]|uniref:Uncharacterized protein n=1 Tax=Ceratocystis fimbriata f. sp. platani TaxID=88771 RepID=A0A0F8B680_CERFI|nr:hypothetical protein CFO_g1457 [Ceratocystis platani]
MRVSTVFLALVASVSVSATEFTRMSYPEGLLRRDSSGYEPEVTSCGKGTTCAEACGAGYETCSSSDKKSHCYNPAAGETCCAYSGGGSSCESKYFCSHNIANTTAAVCCAHGGTLDDCASKNNLYPGALAADPPVSTTTTTTTTKTSTTSTTKSTTSSIRLNTAVYTTANTTTSSIPLSTGIYTASASSGFPVYSANRTVAYTATAVPTYGGKVPGVPGVASGTLRGPAQPTGSTVTSSGATAAPIAALALVAGAFAAFF